MFAVIKTGGKQYRVAQNDRLVVEKLDGEAGETIALGEVLMVSDGASTKVGAPVVAGAQVAAEIVEQRKGEKTLVMKKKRRNTYRRKRGHRQLETVLRIVEILPEGGFKGAAKKAAPVKAEAKPAPAKAAPKASGDDLSLIDGVGPTLLKKLTAEGVTSFAQLAGMTDEQLTALDEALKGGGRVLREEWREQARDLAAGGTPRAKVDQDKAADAAAKPKRAPAKKKEDGEG
jgi:large subunit ribosomal protein L21